MSTVRSDLNASDGTRDTLLIGRKAATLGWVQGLGRGTSTREPHTDSQQERWSDNDWLEWPHLDQPCEPLVMPRSVLMAQFRPLSDAGEIT